MGFRFWRRVKVLPGVTLNLSKSGASVSVGPRGAKVTVGPRGARGTVGLPGTGLFYTTKLQQSIGVSKAKKSLPPGPAIPPSEKLTMGFFKRLATPDNEEAFVDGLRAHAQNNEKEAVEHLRSATHIADAAFLLGVILMKNDYLDEAANYMHAAIGKRNELGAYFRKYGIDMSLLLPITEEVSAQIGPDEKGALLMLVEIYQRLGKAFEAADALERLLSAHPDDAVLKLSLAELIIEEFPSNRVNFEKVLSLTEGIRNSSTVKAALLLYKAKAMRGLGLLDGARDVLTQTMRRKKDRPRELLLAMRYERALIYEDMGQTKRAKSEFERVYADDPDFEDVAEKVGL